MMNVKKLILGKLETNVYLLEFDNDIIVIDPADEPQKILNTAAELGKPIKSVLLTHGHFDHCNGAAQLQKNGAKIYISKADYEMIKNGFDLAKFVGITFNEFIPDGFLCEGKQVVDGHAFSVLQTPGHTAGSLSYVFEDRLFCGDALFFLGVGRTDLPTGSRNQLVESIKKLYSLGNKVVYSGHGKDTTLEFEKENNPYVKA